MKLRVSLLATVILALPTFAHADPQTYMKFLTQLEGQWEGTGYAMGAPSSFQVSAFIVRNGDNPTWDAEWRRSGGISEESGTTFQIAGEILSVNDDMINGGTTNVGDVTDHSLDYTIETLGAQGDFVDYIFHYDLGGDGLTITMHEEVDGTPVYEEDYSLKRQQ
jgi:hypothetical protein